MATTTTHKDGISTLKFEGELRLAAVAEAKAEILAALAAGGEVRFDLGEVDVFGAAGLQLLLMARASARARGLRFRIIAHSASFPAALERVGIPLDCFVPIATADTDHDND